MNQLRLLQRILTANKRFNVADYAINWFSGSCLLPESAEPCQNSSNGGSLHGMQSGIGLKISYNLKSHRIMHIWLYILSSELLKTCLPFLISHLPTQDYSWKSTTRIEHNLNAMSATKTDSCLPKNNSWVVYSSDIKTHVVPNRALMHSLSRVSTLIIKTLAHDTLWDNINSFSFNTLSTNFFNAENDLLH